MALSIPDFSYSCYSDKGPVRECNEDNVHVVPELGLFILADGMGGHRAGDVASATAVAVIEDYIRKSLPSIMAMDGVDGTSEFIQLALIEALKAANREILEISAQNPQYKGLGTTIVCGLLIGNHLVATHAGDSRLYRYQHHKLHQMTSDHSLYQEHIDEYGEADETIPKNIITRVVGNNKACVPEVVVHPVKAGESFFCTSDGVHDSLTEQEFLSILDSDKTINKQTRQLVDLACQNGNEDNASVILIKPGEKLSFIESLKQKFF
jgi:serine/threonine protein phosphatase PrpC